MHSNFFRGTVVMTASSIMFSIMLILIKISPEIDPYKTSFFRFAIGLALLGTAAMANKIVLNFKNIKLLFLRGFFGGISIFLLFYSINKIGLVKGSVIGNMYPVFATIASAIFLKERVNFITWMLIFTSMAGITLISFSKGVGIENINPDDFIAILGAAIGGLAIVIIKKLRETESSFSIFFAQCAIGFWVVLIPANIVPVEIGISGGFILLGIGVSATIGQLMMTYSFKYVSVSKGTIIGMLTPFFNVFIGVLVFNEEINLISGIGLALILFSCAVITISEK